MRAILGMPLARDLEISVCSTGLFLCAAVHIRLQASSLAACAIIMHGMVPWLAGPPTRVSGRPPCRFWVVAFQLQGIEN
jgi:hypothetical protein